MGRDSAFLYAFSFFADIIIIIVIAVEQQSFAQCFK